MYKNGMILIYAAEKEKIDETFYSKTVYKYFLSVNGRYGVVVLVY